jgi:hypothetical protein
VGVSKKLCVLQNGVNMKKLLVLITALMFVSIPLIGQDAGADALKGLKATSYKDYTGGDSIDSLTEEEIQELQDMLNMIKEDKTSIDDIEDAKLRKLVEFFSNFEFDTSPGGRKKAGAIRYRIDL